ncbi:MAG: precorrin-2 C(20)-methyltransferase [Leptolyngbyaceae cyanobacterium MO_188.B28]|nr:precorrin-2 C(20)-methyltransferase [Leptolyngbyaceae cyanobacterium MO_188.B28]
MTDSKKTAPSLSLGTLYGVGVGPGDPELITIKALRLLKSAPVVAFPAGVQGRKGRAQDIISPWLNPDQVQLALKFPYTEDRQILTEAWKVASEEVWLHLQKGRDVVFASEGDVSFYSTFTYLAQTLQQLHPEASIQATPGVCSPLAAAAVLGIPLTIQAQRLAILPALQSVAHLETALSWADVVVLLKVSSVYPQVWSVLDKHQLLDHSYAVENATKPDQVIYADLSKRPRLQLPYFSLLVIQVRP